LGIIYKIGFFITKKKTKVWDEGEAPGENPAIPGKSQENFIPIYGNGNENGKFHSHFRERECK